MSEELVDPLDTLREESKKSPHCVPFYKKLEECSSRQSKTGESCEEEFIDLLECVDHEVASKLFGLLKYPPTRFLPGDNKCYNY